MIRSMGPITWLSMVFAGSIAPFLMFTYTQGLPTAVRGVLMGLMVAWFVLACYDYSMAMRAVRDGDADDIYDFLDSD